MQRSVESRFRQYVLISFSSDIHYPHAPIRQPSGHAFVLRRFDTGAISLTTMFRAAFPTAPEDYEKVEASWVKANYDSYGANGTGRDAASKLRLAGTWIHPDVALTLAPHYSLEHVIEPLTTVHPDPSQEYRRSTKPQSPHVNANTNPSPSKAGPRIEVNAPPASPSPASGPAAKRRKESSPVVAAPIPAESLPPPRRSGRTSISPAPQVARPPRSKGTRTTRGQVKPASVNGRVSTRLTPAESDHAPPAEDAEGDDIAEVPGPDMSQDIAEQKEMIAKLKAERDAKASSTKFPPAEPIVKTESQASKRSREEEEKPLQFNFKEPDEENAVVVRPIASNSRLSLDLEPQQKSAAWGALWFAAGLAAA